MSSEIGRTNSIQKQSEIEITFLNTALGKEGKLLDDITEGKSILEYSLKETEISVKLEDNGIDKDGNRYNLETGLLISEKGKKQKPKNKKANIKDERNDDMIH